jgi:ArsR family transcriptional regulator
MFGKELGVRHYRHAIDSIFHMKNIAPPDVFAALSNAVRLRCLMLIATADDVCVCEVGEALRIAQPAASKALNALKGVGLVTARRDANWHYYSLDEDMPAWARTIVDSTIAELSAREPHRTDQRRLGRLDLRPAACA